MDEREEINLILNHPAYKNSLTRDLLWLQIHKENFEYDLYQILRKLFGKDDGDGHGGKGTARFA